MDNSSIQKLEEFLESQKRLERQVEKLERAHQPIKGTTIIVSDDRIYFNLFAESPSFQNRGIEAYAAQIAYTTVAHDGFDSSLSPAIQFLKKPNMVFIDGTLVVQYYGFFRDTGSAYSTVFNDTVRVRLNPTDTEVTPAYPGTPFIRATGGEILTMDGEPNDYVTPTFNGQTFTKTFTGAELSALVDGMNKIVAQQETADALKRGLAKMYLILNGYESRA